MGHLQHTPTSTSSARARPFPPRECARKACVRTFPPRHWRQRYCQESNCLRELRRWQALKRQRRRRATPEGRRKHAQAEQERRRRRAAGEEMSSNDSRHKEKEQRAWSRNKEIPEVFCDRPGCYQAPQSSQRAPARYCGNDCRRVMRRVLDRERKWRSRKRYAGRYKRELEYQRARLRRRNRCGAAANASAHSASARSRAVGGYRAARQERLSCSTWKEGCRDDRETSAGFSPRAPPPS